MNKFILGLLLIAVTAGIFFVLQKQKSNTIRDLNKELILGKWKIKSYDAKADSSNSLFVGIMALVDSNTLRYDYEFTRKGDILRSFNDSVTNDTSYYQWVDNRLAWQESRIDSMSLLDVYVNADTMRLRADDSTIIVFARVK